MPAADGSLGEALVGEKIAVNSKFVSVTRLLGEGGFSFVYLCKELPDPSKDATGAASNPGAAERKGSGSTGSKRSGSMGKGQSLDDSLVLKVTSIVTRAQRDIAEKEAKLLGKLSHPSIIKMFDTCYRTPDATARRGSNRDQTSTRPQHLILMEFCEGGHALTACAALKEKGEQFQLADLIIAFGQICNAVSYLHAQRPPIVHRDLKPANFLIKKGAYKLCDFGSAIFGHVDLKTPQNRSDAEEVIQKTTTQMFRAPEMVDLYMAKKLTQATDVWALGCCLYSMAFLQNCFEEGSNLAILNANYKIPEENPYGPGLVELLDRMLTVDSKDRADMTEVILCLSAVYSGKELPPRKKRSKPEKEETKDKNERVGTFRTDGQGRVEGVVDLTNPEAAQQLKAKTLSKNSAAYRRRQAASSGVTHEADLSSKFERGMTLEHNHKVNEDTAFSASANPFADFNPTGSTLSRGGSDDMFNSFEDDAVDFDANGLEGAFDDRAFDGTSVSGEGKDHSRGRKSGRIGVRRARSKSRPKKQDGTVDEHPHDEEEKKAKPRRVRSVVANPDGSHDGEGGQRRGRAREDAPSQRSRSVGRKPKVEDP